MMMKSPNFVSIAVRRSGGELSVKTKRWISFAERFPVLKRPVLRGPVVLLESLISGMQALVFSANQALDDGKKEESSKPLGGWALGASVATALIIAAGLFIALPHVITGLMGISVETTSFHIIDGIIKVLIFIGYIVTISVSRDIRRVFQYHGAEHKSINAYEAGLPLSPEAAMKFSTLHPRCGTAFILFVLLISIMIFSAFFPFVPGAWPKGDIRNHILFILYKIALLLPIAGLSYELIRFTDAKKDNRLLKALSLPGLMLQKLTTKEPTQDQLEVAMAALKEALEMEETLSARNDHRSQQEQDCNNARKTRGS